MPRGDTVGSKKTPAEPKGKSPQKTHKEPAHTSKQHKSAPPSTEAISHPPPQPGGPGGDN